MERPPPYEKQGEPGAPQMYPNLGSSPGHSYPPPGNQFHSVQMPQPHPTPAPTVTNVNVMTAPTHGGTCPVCHAGTFKSGFTCCGIFCCIIFFPIGIICCLCMRKKSCSHCGFSAS